MIQIRKAKPGDLEDILRVFSDSIKNVCSNDYNPEQIQVWTASRNDKARWLNKIKNQYFLIAEDKGKAIGFGSIEGDYLDLLYVHPNYLRCGIASMLFEELETLARNNELSKITSDVSITAKTFFERKGFKEIKKNHHIRNGVEIINFTMQKYLGDQSFLK